MLYVVTIFRCASERGAGGEDRVPFDRVPAEKTESVVCVKKKEVIQIAFAFRFVT